MPTTRFAARPARIAERIAMDLGLPLQLELGARLLLAAFLGAVIGMEREVHEHPAGMRTHLLVSAGAAIFTVVSIYGFVSVAGDPGMGPIDPTRVAAQVVSGIGFLGAGAIIKYGTSIRGLTTAGSLWATAAVGMAAGTGQAGIAIAGTAIVLFSLWPLNWIVDRLRVQAPQTVKVRLRLDGLAPLGRLMSEFTKLHVTVAEIRSERVAKDRYELELDLRPMPGTISSGLISHISSIPNVELLEAAT
jgi:uncharacterized membrane protein YhiD involved in acid resistance